MGAKTAADGAGAAIGSTLLKETTKAGLLENAVLTWCQRPY